MSPPLMSPLHTDVCEMFKVALGRRDLGLDDDFFALGGDSLCAASLLLDLEARLGLHLPVHLLAQAPTPRSLVEHLGQITPDGPVQTAVWLRRGPAQRVAYALPGLAGNALTYRRLAQRLQTDVAVRGLQFPGLARGEPAPQTMAELCAAFGRAMPATAQAHSTEHRGGTRPACDASSAPQLTLMGYSFGGVVAQELVVCLAEQGVAVHALVLIDALPAEAQRHASARQAMRDMLDHIAKRVRDRQLDALSQRLVAIESGCLRALRGHRTRPSHCPTLLIHSTQQALPGPTPPAAWAPYLRGPVQCLALPTTHLGVFNAEFEPVLAAAIDGIIQANLR